MACLLCRNEENEEILLLLQDYACQWQQFRLLVTHGGVLVFCPTLSLILRYQVADLFVCW